MMSIIKEPIAEMIWNVKYRYQIKGKFIDQSIEDTWRRVAKAVASAERSAERTHWQEKFYHLLENYRFLPGGRILAGAGTRHRVTLFNCFVMDIREDSLSGIFNALEECALTLQQGGGVGYDFSILRPKGALVKKTGLPSSGPVSFMRIWDTTCSILLSTGVRRGAMMGVMRCDHPDIIEFIEAKRDSQALRHFNVSVYVTDAFMQAVKQDEDWILRDGQRLRARDLWNKIIRSAYEYAEPGVLFGDTINRMNNLWYRETINATNPCGEIPLPPYGACDLGAINLTQFVIAPFTPRAHLDWIAIEDAVQLATRFLDNVIDISRYPLKAQRIQAQSTRRIGLGLTGLADVFVMLGLRYGEATSLALAGEIMRRIADVTWRASIELAREKGAFPYYASEYLQGAFMQSLDASIQREVAKYGIRNSHHNTIAPTGTTSLLANNVSNGIEPVFCAEYKRHVRLSGEDIQTFQVRDYAYHLWRHLGHMDGLPPAWREVNALTPEEHLAVQGVMQQYVDNAISKTINLPQDYPFEKLADIYSHAYALGLKGCTIFRPNAVTGVVLESSEACCTQDQTTWTPN